MNDQRRRTPRRTWRNASVSHDPPCSLAEGADVRTQRVSPHQRAFQKAGHADFHEVRLKIPPPHAWVTARHTLCAHPRPRQPTAPRISICRGATGKCLIALRLTAKRPRENNLGVDLALADCRRAGDRPSVDAVNPLGASLARASCDDTNRKGRYVASSNSNKAANPSRHQLNREDIWQAY
jgi:hypothetical protein